MSRRALKLALRRTIIYIDKNCPGRRDRWAETGGQERDCEERKYNPDRRYRQTRYERVGMLLLVDVVVVVPDVVSVNGDIVVDVAVVHVVVVVDVVPVAVIVVAVVVVVVVVRLYIFLFLFGRYLPLNKKCAFFYSFFFLQFLRYSEFSAG